MMPSVNNKYKTSMCRNFEQTGFCPLAAKCHFAHGKGELRKITDPLPAMPRKPLQLYQPQINPKPTPNYVQYSLPPTITNYKTVKCKFFEQGFCKFGQNCGFAHGDSEIRDPSSPLPQNILNASSQFSNTNNTSPVPTMYDSNVQNHVAQQQIFYLINQMQAFHANDPDLLAKIKYAEQLNTSGNVQTAASEIHNVMNRPDKSKEDSDNYANFVQNIQGLGPSLYQHMQVQQPGMSNLGGPSPLLNYPQNQGMTTSMTSSYGYQQNGQNQIPTQENLAQVMSASTDLSGMSNHSMHNNMMGGYQQMGNYNPNQMSMSTGNPSKKF